MPTLISLQVGMPQHLGDAKATNPMERAWESGFIKAPITESVWLSRTNLQGDGQADLFNHGGFDKAVCVYAAEHYPYWRTQLNLPEFPYGAFGENFTVEELNEQNVCIGDIYKIGAIVVQVSQPRQPCWKLARRWQIRNLTAQVIRNGRTGWYFRVLQAGNIAAGTTIELIERPAPEWTIAKANEIMHFKKGGEAAAATLAACPLLSANWRLMLQSQY